MRLENINPRSFTPEQRSLFDTLETSIEKHLKGFVSHREDGALIGPFNILLHFPALGVPIWSVFTALAEHSALPPSVRETVILLTGARCSALYELYSHEAVAKGIGMTPEKIASLAAGQRPADLTPEESVAFDLVTVLHRGGGIPESTYKAGLERFGKQGLAELACTAGTYCIIGFLLNTFDVSLPDTELGR